MKIETPAYFLDANVFIQIIPHNKLNNLLTKLEAKLPDSNLIVCTELIDEIKDVLTRPAFLERAKQKYSSENEYLQLLEVQVESICEFANPFIVHPVIISELIPKDDPDDHYIYNFAKQQGFTVITGDKHILQLKNTPFPIIHSKEFLTWL